MTSQGLHEVEHQRKNLFARVSRFVLVVEVHALDFRVDSNEFESARVGILQHRAELQHNDNNKHSANHERGTCFKVRA